MSVPVIAGNGVLISPVEVNSSRPAPKAPDSLAPSFTAPRLTVPQRIPELDGVRGIAILMVLFYHLLGFTMDWLTNLYGVAWHGFPKAVLLLTRPGFLGVDLFFVLSGYLISGILLDTRGDQHYLKNFYIRRALRIMPLYLVCLVAILVFYRGSGLFVVLCLLFIPNMAMSLHVPIFNSALWSLAVEEHFYLLWPWLIKYARMRTVAIVSALICMIEPLVRLASVNYVYDVYFYSWFRFDGLAWGALAACFVRTRWYSVRSTKRVICASGAAGIVLIAAGAPFGMLHRKTPLGASLQFPASQLIFVALILFAIAFSGAKVSGILRSGFLRITGDLSYALYIVHLMVADVCVLLLRVLGRGLTPGPRLFQNVCLLAVMVLVGSYGVAFVSRRVLELPALRLKRLLAPTSHPHVAAVT